MKVVEIISERVFKAGYVLRKEMIEDPSMDEPMEWTMAYDLDGGFIGDPKTAYRLCVKRGIRPQVNKPDHSTSSIGFSSKDGKWYGWSHRAMYGFKIGSTCKKGDCHYQAANKRDFHEDCKRFWSDANREQIKAKAVVEDGVSGVYVSWKYSKNIPNEDLRSTINGVFTPYPSDWGRGEHPAKTVADAKQMACDFASSVS